MMKMLTLSGDTDEKLHNAIAYIFVLRNLIAM